MSSCYINAEGDWCCIGILQSVILVSELLTDHGYVFHALKSKKVAIISEVRGTEIIYIYI